MHWRTRHTHIRTRYYTDFGQRHAAGSRAHKQDEQSRERQSRSVERSSKTPPFSCFPSLPRLSSALSLSCTERKCQRWQDPKELSVSYMLIYINGPYNTHHRPLTGTERFARATTLHITYGFKIRMRHTDAPPLLLFLTRHSPPPRRWPCAIATRPRASRVGCSRSAAAAARSGD